MTKDNSDFYRETALEMFNPKIERDTEGHIVFLFADVKMKFHKLSDVEIIDKIQEVWQSLHGEMEALLKDSISSFVAKEQQTFN